MKLTMYKSNSCGACQLLETQIPRIEFLLGTQMEKVNLSENPERKIDLVKSLPTIVLETEGGSKSIFEGWGQADIIYETLIRGIHNEGQKI